jgi:hypothetical protein
MSSPRSLEFTVFVARARQAMEINGLPTLNCVLSTPPTGQANDKVILSH